MTTSDEYLKAAQQLASARLDPTRVSEQMAANARGASLSLVAITLGAWIQGITDPDGHDPGDEDRSER